MGYFLLHGVTGDTGPSWSSSGADTDNSNWFHWILFGGIRIRGGF